jgi:nicotinamidase-related amidase
MTLLRTVLLSSGLILTLSSAAAEAQQTPTGKPMVTLQMPGLPDPVPVTLNPRTTALMVMDYVQDICGRQPKCSGQMLPALTTLMARARQAGVTVAYGTRAQNVNKWMPQIAPKPGDITIVSTAQDRFYGTDLDKDLKAKGITTIIMAGWKNAGSVAYTDVGATVHGYTTVIPVDTTAASTDYETTLGFYQILNQGGGNLMNQPLKPKSVTLSRTNLITFQ